MDTKQRKMQEVEPHLPKKQHPVHKHLWASADGRVFSEFKGSVRHGVPVSEIGGRTVKGKYRVVSVAKDPGEYTQVTLGQVVWECFGGPMPKHFRVDHINNLPTDVRLENLRLATQVGVTQNGGMRKNNASGYKGVWFDSRLDDYRAAIMAKRRRIHLGGFPSAKEAARTRMGILDYNVLDLTTEFAHNFPLKYRFPRLAKALLELNVEKMILK